MAARPPRRLLQQYELVQLSATVIVRQNPAPCASDAEDEVPIFHFTTKSKPDSAGSTIPTLTVTSVATVSSDSASPRVDEELTAVCIHANHSIHAKLTCHFCLPATHANHSIPAPACLPLLLARLPQLGAPYRGHASLRGEQPSLPLLLARLLALLVCSAFSHAANAMFVIVR